MRAGNDWKKRQGQAHGTNRDYGKYKLGSLRKDVLHNIYKKYFQLLLKKDILSPDFA